MSKQETTKIDALGINVLESYTFIEKVIDVIEADSAGLERSKEVEALLVEAQKLLDKKDKIDDFGKRIAAELNKDNLATARSLIVRMEQEIGSGPDVNIWKQSVAYMAAW